MSKNHNGMKEEEDSNSIPISTLPTFLRFKNLVNLPEPIELTILKTRIEQL